MYRNILAASIKKFDTNSAIYRYYKEIIEKELDSKKKLNRI